jgi:MFS family permease
MIGDWFSYVAVSVVVLGSDTALVGVALVLVAHTIPRVVAAPFAGVLADRIDLRTILIWMSLLRGCFAMAMLASLTLGSIAALQLLLVGRMAFGSFVDAATMAAIPRLVERIELPLANTIRGVLWSVVFALAVAVGGLATATLGPELALLIDALTFLVSAFIFRGLASLPAARTVKSTAAGNWQAFMQTHPNALRIALSKLPVAIANGAAWVALHAVTESWTHAAFGVGILHACRAIGTGLGPVLWRRSPGLDGHRGVVFSITATFIGTALFVTNTAPIALAIAAVVWGLGVGANWVATTTRIQMAVPEAILGRIGAIDIAAQTVGQCFGGVVCAVLASRLGVANAACVSLALAVASLCAIEGLQHARRRLCARTYG